MSRFASADRDPDLQALLDRVLDEQQASWERGERVPVEAYVARHPALGADDEAMLDLIYQEILLRRGRAEEFDPDEFVARFPNRFESLALQLAAGEALDSLLGAQTCESGADEAGPSLPATIEGYEIVGILGRGGMGIVYEARDVRLGRRVALKVIAGGLAADPERRARFEVEARAAARLQHPHILNLHKIGEHGGCPFLDLEYAAGGSLAEQMAEQPQPVREAAALVATLAEAIHAAHEQGIVHRDLKPGNVLLTAEGVPKVSDFGLAKLLDDDSLRTQTGELLGTPSFMAPEQVEGRPSQVGRAADVYALGAILYQALTGRPPFVGASVAETLRQVSTVEVTAPRRLRPDVPRDLETICLKCLEKPPARRYATAQSLADDLRRFLEGRPIAARAAGRIERTSRWCRRNPLPATLIATLAMITVFSVTVTVFSVTQMFRATRAESASRAINAFLTKDLLAQASVHRQALAGRRPDPELTVRTALDRAAATIDQRFAGQPILEASIRQTIGESYHELGLYPQAIAHLQRAVVLRRRWLGDAHTDTMRATGSLGAVYLSDQRLAVAEPLVRGALRGLQAALGHDHADTLGAIALVAELNYYQGKMDDAENLLIGLRQAYQRTMGDDASETLDTVNGLAQVYLAQRKPERAEEVLAAALAKLPGKLSADHPTALALKVNMADAAIAQHKTTRAERLYEEAIGDLARVLGKAHPDRLAAMAKLGVFLANEGKADRAEPLLSETLEGCRAALDRNHEATDAALSGLALVYAARQDRAGLGTVIEEAARIARTRYGLSDETAGRGCEAAGIFFFTVGNYPEAENYVRDALTYFTTKAPDHHDRYFNELLYGVSLLAQKKLPEARTHLLLGYNGIRHGRNEVPPPDPNNLGALMEQVLRLPGADGRLLVESTALGKLRNDPMLRAVVLDLQFPVNPFASGR